MQCSKGGATFVFSLPLTIRKDHQLESMAINNIAITMTNNIEEEEEELRKILAILVIPLTLLIQKERRYF